VWCGAFTSVAAASMSYGYWPDTPEKTACSRAAAVGWEDGVPFAQGLLVDVFDDRVEILCRDFVGDETLGEPWILPRQG
jgi:hypothetical protein